MNLLLRAIAIVLVVLGIVGTQDPNHWIFFVSVTGICVGLGMILDLAGGKLVVEQRRKDSADQHVPERVGRS